MCFYLDYDWSAEVYEETSGPAKKDLRCDECSRPILAGQWHKRIYQQEYECCPECYGEKNEKQKCRTCDDEEYTGETHDYERCEDCDKLLQAIKAFELAAGCSQYNSQPYLCGLFEAMTDSGDGHEYALKAAEMFPELKASGYLDRWLEEEES